MARHESSPRDAGRAPHGRLLIVDDEVAQLRALCETLCFEGYVTEGFSSPLLALAGLKAGRHDLLLTDLMMPHMDGIELVVAARQIDPEMGAIIMTGNGTIDTAVQAMQVGALDYILKPFRLNVMLPVIARALNLQRLRRENAMLLAQERRHAVDLAAAYQDLEAFSYSVSHDLRAPLLFVKDFAQRLQDEYSDQLGEEGQRLVGIIRDGSRSMDEMVVGLLAFARASRQPLQAQRLDMQPIVEACLQDALQAHNGSAPRPTPQIYIEPLPAAMADSVVIRSVWSNLIGNALKYSALRDAPRIDISGSIEGAEAIYTVADNGVGLDMRYADKLFTVFRRLHSARDFPGTGVGLAIAHRIVQRHGGRIWAESSPNAGSRFCFTLPIMAPDTH
ncbi:MAG: response regulator [Gammaproteobacteria bacterium]|nr:response regulator [Gammaproteobacteria bacterium]